MPRYLHTFSQTRQQQQKHLVGRCCDLCSYLLCQTGLYYIGCQYCTGEREFLPDGEIALASFCCRGAAAMALL